MKTFLLKLISFTTLILGSLSAVSGIFFIVKPYDGDELISNVFRVGFLLIVGGTLLTVSFILDKKSRAIS